MTSDLNISLEDHLRDTLALTARPATLRALDAVTGLLDPSQSHP